MAHCERVGIAAFSVEDLFAEGWPMRSVEGADLFVLADLGVISNRGIFLLSCCCVISVISWEKSLSGAELVLRFIVLAC